MLLIHVSDIHLANDHEGISFVPMLQAVQHHIRAHNLVIFAITGDLAYSGKKDQYIVFETLLLELEERAMLLNPSLEIRWVIIPGNHDCDFDRNLKIRDICVKDIKENGLVLDEADT